MKLEKVIEQAKDFIEEVNENTIQEVPTYIFARDIKWAEILLNSLEQLKQENEELKEATKNVIAIDKIEETFLRYEERRKKGEPVVGYWTLKEFIKKLLEKNQRKNRNEYMREYYHKKHPGAKRYDTNKNEEERRRERKAYAKEYNRKYIEENKEELKKKWKANHEKYRERERKQARERYLKKKAIQELNATNKK